MNRLIDFSSRFRILKGGKISLVVSAFLGGAIIANAAPSGGTVTSGNATINQSGNVTNINQSSSKASINWNNFSIKANETVNFNQPNSNSITLNRVIGTEKSVIDGALNANGQVWILNSNGILFGKNASVNTAGLLATTAQLSDADFQAGNYNFKNSSSNSVINLGTIKVENSSYVVLAGREVQNGGNIEAVKGKVHLVGADSYSINLNGNSLVNLKVNKGVLDAMVSNSGNILANGGEIFLTTNAVDELLKGVVNNTGIIEANSLDGITGKVELFAHGGEVQVGGTIEAKDGFVETSGKDFKVADNFKIKAKEWLIDPTDITVEATGSTTDLTSNSIKASFIESTLNGGTGVTLQADNNIYVNEDIAWNQSILALKATGGNVNINSTLTANGTAGLSVTKGGDFNVAGKVNFTGTNNYLSIDGFTYTIIKSLADLQNMNNNLTLKYALGIDIDASATSTWNVGDHDGDTNTAQVAMGWNPIGNSTTTFTGNFDGLGHTIDALKINRPTENNIGLFGKSSGSNSSISNIRLTNIDFTGNQYVGGIIGFSYSKLSNVSASGDISFTKYAGGLVGTNYANIDKSYANIDLISTTNLSYAGGLVGANYSQITNSYAIGSVNAVDYIGGLVGSNGGTIENSYSTTTITASGSNKIGGLVGNQIGTVTNSWYDNQVNTSSSMADKDTYGKTKAQIVVALSPLEAWTAGGGASVEGYSTATALTLPQLVAFYTSDGEILFAGGFGTEVNPYTITNWTQLQNINNSNILTQNYYFKLLNDLNSTISDYTNLASNTANSGAGWNPLGNSTNKFTGNFNGNNYNISNLFINRPTQDYIGLFGYTSGATISNLGLSSVNILGNNYIGGLIGRSHNTNISKTYISGTINGNNYIGGLVGENYIIYPNIDTTGIYVTNSYSTANVSGNDYIGGFVGYNNIDNGVLYIQYNYASGLVHATGSNFGGLIGRNYVRYNYAMQLKVENSYFNTDTTGTTSSYGGTGYTSEQFKNRSNFNNWDNTIWSFYDESVEGFAVNIRPYLKNITAEIDKPTTFLLFSQGFGTEANPYGITNWTQLQNINNYSVITKSYHFDLLNDLNSSTLGYASEVKNGETLANNGMGWKIIGKDNPNNLVSEKFSGTFDGLGYTIDSLIINIPSSINVTINGQFVGLFAETDNAIIKNIGLTNIDVIGIDAVGGLVGYNYQSSISNSYVTGNISGYNAVGGLIGTNDNSSIINSYSDAEITNTAEGYSFGGLVGASNNSTIKDSYATGNVSGYDKVGGLVGSQIYSSSITNSYAMGHVIGTGDYIGGLVGMSDAPATITTSYATGDVEGANYVGGLAGSSGNSIRNSYATGDVTGTSNVGGLLGQNLYASIDYAYSTGKVTGTGSNVRGLIGENLDPETIVAYYDKTVNTGMADESSYGKTTDELKTLTTFSGWDIQTDSSIAKGTPFLAWQRNGNTYTKIWVIGTKVASTGGNTSNNENSTGGNTSTTNDVSKVITAIVNTSVLQTPKINVLLPQPIMMSTPTTAFNGERVNLVSQPIQNQNTTMVTMGELRAEQNPNNPNGNNDIRVPVGDNSVIELINGGVTLPDGVEQQFFVVNTENNNI